MSSLLWLHAAWLSRESDQIKHSVLNRTKSLPFIQAHVNSELNWMSLHSTTSCVLCVALGCPLWVFSAVHSYVPWSGKSTSVKTSSCPKLSLYTRPAPSTSSDSTRLHVTRGVGLPVNTESVPYSQHADSWWTINTTNECLHHHRVHTVKTQQGRR